MERVVPPSMRFKAITLGEYRKAYLESINRIEDFWSREARSLVWEREWTLTREGSGPSTRWFVGGVLSPYKNVILRHRDTSAWSKTAILYVDENGDGTALTYSDLDALATRVSCGLLRLGLKRGEWVAVYSPPNVESFAFMLGAMRAGLPFEPIFTGFSPAEMARRVVSRGARALFVSPRYLRRGKLVDLLSTGKVYLERLSEKGVKVIVGDSGGGYSGFTGFSELVSTGCDSAVEAVESTHPLFGLHSGYVDDFKPITHPTGGFLVQAWATSRWIGMRPRDTVFCTVWPGWITGVTYQLFGPLMLGSTLLLYDGAPDWPNWGRWLDIVDSYAVTLFITTSSAVRIMSRQDPALFYGKNDTLRGVIVTAEPLEPEYWRWAYNTIGSLPYPIIDSNPGRGGSIPVLNMFIQSEVGTFFTGNLINYTFTHIEPGSAGPPFPGFHVDIVDETGNPIRGRIGRLVIRQPWPSIPIEAPEDFQRAWSRGYYDTGDLALINSEGYIFPTGRGDAVMKVSGYRLSPGALERAAVSAGAEWALALPLKDPERLEAPVLFYYGEAGEEVLVKAVREGVGPIAAPVRVVRVARKPTSHVPREVLAPISRRGDLDAVIGLLESQKN
ncbi:AMP-binding protein [Infirmifilum lucidum]|uniref:AMP-binding protein n=1 Tax=Infirmifilum lucidum TaxID=2776706 RepID=A0A7L9FFX0_9CREN|nr:AMP-binding protein [Infirmifilum lucidum]QOJ78708.1 AMP-binding protein [Infirmifilum lucidum]